MTAPRSLLLPAPRRRPSLAIAIGATALALAALLAAGQWLAVLHSHASQLATPRGDARLRFATFNIENFATDVGTAQFEAAALSLRRVSADVVCVQEMISATAFVALADATGYPHRFLASTHGTLDRRASGILSALPLRDAAERTSAGLSGDPESRDITRNFAVATLGVPGAATEMLLICNHWSSLSADAGEFSRSVESVRAAQIVRVAGPGTRAVVVAGDMNEDIGLSPDEPATFDTVPDGLSSAFRLGADIRLPLANSPFLPLRGRGTDLALAPVDARQVDGSNGTERRGFRIDYIWLGGSVEVRGAEVYDSQDEALGGGLAKMGLPLAPETSAAASDHRPVFADLRLPSASACGPAQGGRAVCLPGVWKDRDLREG